MTSRVGRLTVFRRGIVILFRPWAIVLRFKLRYVRSLSRQKSRHKTYRGADTPCDQGYIYWVLYDFLGWDLRLGPCTVTCARIYLVRSGCMWFK